eukprot:1414294-Amphidinium_carterae.1
MILSTSTQKILQEASTGSIPDDGSCPSTCEHAECGLEDTPVHKLLSCPATRQARAKAGWTLRDSERVTSGGFPCSHYGFWSMPQNWIRDLAHGAPSVVSFDFISEVSRRLRSSRNICHLLSPRLDFWVTMLPSQHSGARAAVVSHVFCAGAVLVKQSIVVKDTVTRADLEWLSHVLALCLVSLLECDMVHAGVVRTPKWSDRDHSRKDYWNSLRRGLDLSCDSFLSESETVGPPPVEHTSLVESTRKSLPAIYPTTGKSFSAVRLSTGNEDMVHKIHIPLIRRNIIKVPIHFLSKTKGRKRQQTTDLMLPSRERQPLVEDHSIVEEDVALNNSPTKGLNPLQPRPP